MTAVEQWMNETIENSFNADTNVFPFRIKFEKPKKSFLISFQTRLLFPVSISLCLYLCGIHCRSCLSESTLIFPQHISRAIYQSYFACGDMILYFTLNDATSLPRNYTVGHVSIKFDIGFYGVFHLLLWRFTFFTYL